MATNKTTCYTAVCDGCRAELETDFIPHFPSPGDAVGYATECDWVRVGDKLYCEGCGEGKGVPCAGCDDLVEQEGERCTSCLQEDREEINAPS